METNISSKSDRQKSHYEKIHSAYESHYYDSTSIKYREEFILQPLFVGDSLDNKRIVELACGSGFNSVYLKLKFKNLSTTGLDISENACVSYKSNTGERAILSDITKPLDTQELFDAGLIVGGLHHCIADLPQAIKNIASLIKPNGTLYLMEPNSDFFLNALRNRWYKIDKYFDAETEHALSHDEILLNSKSSFELIKVHYFGGPAYFFILNSLILRMPKFLKWWITPPLFFIERLFSKIASKKTAPCFLAKWRRI